jgi:hypothetical protein
MANHITIPVFIATDSDGTIGSPATVADKLKAAAGKVVFSLAIDEESLRKSIDSALSMINVVRQQLDDASDVKLNTFSVDFGISSTGKVGFSGSGLDVQLASKFQVTFKIDESHDNKRKNGAV